MGACRAAGQRAGDHLVRAQSDLHRVLPQPGVFLRYHVLDAIDQKFINGRNIYENISELVDELFTDYLRKQGFVEPLAAKFCNGVTVTCSGLSQWGSQYLAQDGANSIDILRTYYGEDVEFVTNAPVQNLQESYPGSPVRRGDIGVNVSFLQVALNRISQNYPAIPKVPVDAIFGEATENAVRAFQSIFL